MSTSWRYQAITRTGHETAGCIDGDKSAVVKQLTDQGMYVVSIQREHWTRLKNSRPLNKPSASELSQLFEDMGNMEAAGMSLPQMLAALQETARNGSILDVLAMMEKRVACGDSLAQAIAHTGVFPWIAAATVQAAQHSGGFGQSFIILSGYFRRREEIRAKLAEALIYPAIFFTVLMAVMMFIGLRVIPRLQELLPNKAAVQPLTQAVLILSMAVQKFWVLMALVPAAMVWAIVYVRQRNRILFERWIYSLPLTGRVVKESDMAQYFLNLSVLLKSGVALLRAVGDLNALDPSQVSRSVFNCREYMFSGMSFWESVKMEGFFPSMVVFTLRRGEELARLDSYCSTLAEYYNKQVNMRVDRLLLLIQPLLLLAGGGFLAAVAFAFLVPIYGNLSKIAGG